MRIFGIGTDLTSISRIRRMLADTAFLGRCFSAEEQRYFARFSDPAPHVAAAWCAKEAAVKALGCGFADCGYLDVELCHDERGRPLLQFCGRLADKTGGMTAHISISHTEEQALATVVLCQGEEEER